mmetsp:Transcript_40261/g.95596  ORF Transcript_40261/g.95596 Transcript_40261/m.95596 type:complete len:494 (-) Transcript_40261:84-1565(-)
MEAGVIGLDLAGLVEGLEEADDVAERHLAVGRVRQEMLVWAGVERGGKVLDARKLGAEESMCDAWHCGAVEGVAEVREALFMQARDLAHAHARPVPPGPPSDLQNLPLVEVADLLAVELLRRAEHHPLDLEVEAHADGVGGDEDGEGVALVGVVEGPGLVLARLGREGPVDDTAAMWSALFDHFLDLVDFFPAEGHHAVSGLHVLQRPSERLGGHLEGRETLVIYDLQVVSAHSAKLFNQRHCPRFATKMKLFARQPQYRSSPRPPAVFAVEHLHLVHHPDVDHLAKVDHLDRRRHMPCSRHDDFLLPRDETAGLVMAGDETLAEFVVDFPGQQPQRAAVYSTLRLRESGKSLMRLPTVCWSDVHNPSSLHVPGLRKPQMRLSHVCDGPQELVLVFNGRLRDRRERSTVVLSTLRCPSKTAHPVMIAATHPLHLKLCGHPFPCLKTPFLPHHHPGSRSPFLLGTARQGRCTKLRGTRSFQTLRRGIGVLLHTL